MKLIEYAEDYSIDGEWILLETADDLAQYASFLSAGVEGMIHDILHARVSVDRMMGHYSCGNGHANGVWAAACTRAYCAQEGAPNNPLYYIETFHNMKLDRMKDYMLEGKKLAVNSLGGYHPVPENAEYEVIGEEDFSSQMSSCIKIRDGAKVINLENDPRLEKVVKDRLGDNFSYVLQLRQFRGERLRNILTEFVQSGGEEMFQYTTGMDTVQMDDYVEQGVAAGIKKFVFQFSSGYSEHLKEWIEDIVEEYPEATFEVIDE